MTGSSPVPVTHVATDLEHGGRWTSLRLAGREWLWFRDDVRRSSVSPGDEFVDAGGLEECIPTVRGLPDHGAAWSRTWRHEDGADVVDCPDFRLRRRLRAEKDAVVASYRLTAAHGFRFVWAAHALLALSPAARIELPDGLDVRLFPEAGPHLPDGWPAGATHVVGRWPTPFGLPLGKLGSIDGSAIGAVVEDCPGAEVVDGADRLTFRLTSDTAVPVSLALWRNLGGFPAGAPYRSIGVEPMMGRVFDLAEAAPDDAATVPESGVVEWQLRVTADSRS